MTEESSGSCVICQRRDPRYPQVCDSDRSWLASALREIPSLAAELSEPVTVQRDLRPKVITEEDKPVVTRWPADPVAHHLRADPVPGARAGGRVSGSKEPPSPTPVTPLDLTAPERVPVTRTVYKEQPSDQVGELSVATVLDGWVRDWRITRDRGEGLPEPEVPTLAGWLLNRLDWACDDNPAVDEFAADISHLRAILRSVLGLREVPDYKVGVPCRRCDSLTLFRVNGSDWIECGQCPDLMSPEEYERWVGLVAAAVKGKKKATEEAGRLRHRSSAVYPA